MSKARVRIATAALATIGGLLLAAPAQAAAAPHQSAHQSISASVVTNGGWGHGGRGHRGGWGGRGYGGYGGWGGGCWDDCGWGGGWGGGGWGGGGCGGGCWDGCW